MNVRSLDFLSFDDVWKMRIDHPYSVIVKDKDLLWSCGQCPLDSGGDVLHPGELSRQALAVAGFIRNYLGKIGSDVSSIGQLIVYYVRTGEEDAQALIDLYRGEFGDGLLITPVSVPFFYYEGMLIEVDVFGTISRKHHRRIIDQKTGIELELVDAGTVTWATLAARDLPAEGTDLTAALQYLAETAGLVAQNLLCSQWFAANEAALALVDAASSIGWCRNGAVGIDHDGYHIFAELTFCREPVANMVITVEAPGEGGEAVEINLSRSRDHFSIYGRKNGGEGGLVSQTKAIMAAFERTLIASGLDFKAVRKSTTYYVAGSSAEELHDNMAVRNAYYSKPGPASTGLPVKAFWRSDARISVRLFG
ncbi:hypothetical protein [Labrys neptuniae]